MTPSRQGSARHRAGTPAAADDAAQAGKLPQSERVLAKGYEILCTASSEDELLLQILGEQDGKKFKSVNDDDALPPQVLYIYHSQS